jgi:PIN domain nuclease of toxin-antitoxin system
VVILDASAMLAFLLEEPGQEPVAEAIATGAAAGTANLAEVMTVLTRGGMPAKEASEVITELPIVRFDIDLDLALRAGAMIRITRPSGLSLGDRLCLALAAREGAPALTADRAWLQVADAVGVKIDVIR